MLALIVAFFAFFSPAEAGQQRPIKRVDTDTIPKLLRPKASDSLNAKFLYINRIFILGNRRTREQIILRELSIQPGDVIYSLDLPGLIDLDKKKLINTRLFNKVDIRTLDVDPGTIDILIDVNERWYTFPAPVFELADRNFNDWWENYNHDFRRVNYGLRLYQYNMRGRNETLRFLAQFGFQRRFELHYRFPYIDKKQKHGLTVEFEYLDLKNVPFRTQDHRYEFLKSDQTLRSDLVAGLMYTYRKSFYRTHSITLEYRDALIKDTIRVLNPNYFPQGENPNQMRYSFLSYLFNADHRDFFAYPLKGYHFMASVTKTGLTPNDDVDKLEGTVWYSHHFDMGKNYYLSNNSVFHASTPKDISYVNYSALGQRKIFTRGYELYLIEGPTYFVNKTTLKKLLFSRVYHWGDMPIDQFRHIPVAVYLKTYADFGYVENYPAYHTTEDPNNTRLADKWLQGIGAGIDVVTFYDVVLRFEYTLNGERERGFFFHVRKEF